MFAVIKTGGKQYKVAVGDIIEIEKLEGEPKAKIEFKEVLMVDDKVGTPLLEKAVVKGEIIDQAKAEKVLVFKKKRRQHYHRMAGHRQNITVVEIKEIKA